MRTIASLEQKHLDLFRKHVVIGIKHVHISLCYGIRSTLLIHHIIPFTFV